jgi:hypothetical protein
MELLFSCSGNHDIYVDKNQQTFWSKSKDGNPKCDSYFGDKNHIRRLMDFEKKYGRNFIDENVPTEKALELFSGMHSRLVGVEGKEFWLLSF